MLERASSETLVNLNFLFELFELFSSKKHSTLDNELKMIQWMIWNLWSKIRDPKLTRQKRAPRWKENVMFNQFNVWTNLFMNFQTLASRNPFKEPLETPKFKKRKTEKF